MNDIIAEPHMFRGVQRMACEVLGSNRIQRYRLIITRDVGSQEQIAKPGLRKSL